MAIDPDLTAVLAELAEKLETLAGITPSAALKNDMEISTRIKRITDAIEFGALEAHALNSHTDITISSPVVDEFLGWDGIDWKNLIISLSALPAIGLDDLDNVVLTAPFAGQIIIKDAGTGNWINQYIYLNETVFNDVQIYLPIADGEILRWDTSIPSSPPGGKWRNNTHLEAGIVSADGTVSLTGAWNAGQNITVPTIIATTGTITTVNSTDVNSTNIEADNLYVNATADHSLTNSADDLVITNPTSMGGKLPNDKFYFQK